MMQKPIAVAIGACLKLFREKSFALPVWLWR
jgi:hypothetical protein